MNYDMIDSIATEQVQQRIGSIAVIVSGLLSSRRFEDENPPDIRRKRLVEEATKLYDLIELREFSR